MSEEDRAAKAARAKAMLKRRQQQKEKKGDSSAAPAGNPIRTAASPTPDGSRTQTPEPKLSPPPGTGRGSGVDDLFSQAEVGDTSWIASLPRVGDIPEPAPAQISDMAPASTSEPPVIPHTHARSVSPRESENVRAQRIDIGPSGTLPEYLNRVQQLLTEVEDQRKIISALESEKRSPRTSLQELESKKDELLQQERSRNQDLELRVQDLDATTQSQQQTIALLVSEKASLATSLEHLESIEAGSREKDTLLKELNAKNQALHKQTQQLAAEKNEARAALLAKEKELMDKYREQERKLQLTTADLNTMRAESKQHQRTIRELQEQIQSDDTVERLESSLKHFQDRADELEFKLSKLKQTNNALKVEKEEATNQLLIHREGEADWKAKHRTLQEELSAAHAKLDTLISDRESLLQDKTFAEASLKAQLATATSKGAELQDQLNRLTLELEAKSRQCYTLQAELRGATRRAEEAEQINKELQSEGTTLMRSLEEMRTKVVELTDANLERGEKVDALEHALRGRDSVIARLELASEEARVDKERTAKRHQELFTQDNTRSSAAQADYNELQTAYEELQAELDAARKKIELISADREAFYQEGSRRTEDINRLAASSDAQAAELTSMQMMLEEHKVAEAEREEFLSRAQNEIEALRLELASKEAEIEKQRASASSVPSPKAPSRALDSELVSALRQQHALDLSAAHSTIRALETSVFNADARSHSFQKYVRGLEDELARFRAATGDFTESSSLQHLRLGSQASNHAHKSHKSLKLGNDSAFAQSLTPETRHKRKVSLSMLKARMESEVATASTSHPPSRALSPEGPPRRHSALQTVPEPLNEPPWSHIRKPQFLDEAHVFWCHSCQGDLVIL